MSKRFNPYHSWLGIPVAEQPANHYRLLGIPLFETNEDVIQNGLDQRMAYVKSFAAGPHSADSQRLLTELSQAGVSLLRPEKKQAYDSQLRSRLKANAETVVLPAAPPVAPPDPEPVVAPPAAAGLPLQRAAGPAPTDEIPAETGPTARFPIVPTIVGSAIGLAVACLVLFLLSPGGGGNATVARHDPPDTAPAVPEPSGTAKGGTIPPPQPEPAPPESTSELQPQPAGIEPSPVQPEPQPVESPFRASNSPPPNWPTPVPGSPAPTPAIPPSQPAPSGVTPPQNTASPFGVPVATVTGPPGERKSIVLDLERSTMRVSVAEEVEGKDVEAQIQSISQLSTSYTLQPDDGIVAFGQPVEVELSEYPGVKIRLSLRRRGTIAELEVAPEIDIGSGKTIDFSKKTLDRASGSMRNHATDLNQQLTAFQAEATAIQNWLASPGPKPIPVRGARMKRLNDLTSQAIPALQKQIANHQSRMDVLQKFSLLARQIHEKASLDLLVQVKPAQPKQ
ncbi:MAG: hypothetical protein GXX96_12810 [Planctomycetaceae bacterium]|nr:hypothetical protein [Planctomycetaceae bacterium]